jgi:hypothetical protein
MTRTVTTFVVLRGEHEEQVAELARLHAAIEPSLRRVVLDDGTFGRGTAPGVVALTLRPDGSICDRFDRFRALSAPWIENGFLRAAR